MALIEQDHLKVTFLTVLTFLFGVLSASEPTTKDIFFTLMCFTVLLYYLPTLLAKCQLTSEFA